MSLRLIATPLLLLLVLEPDGTLVDFRRATPPALSDGAMAARFGKDTITVTELNQLRRDEPLPARGTRRSSSAVTTSKASPVRVSAGRFAAASTTIRRVEAAKRVMVQELLKQELDERAEAIGEAQVKQYYEAHKDDYVKPAMTRLAHIAFSKERRAQAELVLAQALALTPMDYAAFGKLARDHSEDAKTKVLDGDMRFMSDDELDNTAELRDVALTRAHRNVAPALVGRRGATSSSCRVASRRSTCRSSRRRPRFGRCC
jgi:peptidyl-prolyl cis-trans isomerase C